MGDKSESVTVGFKYFLGAHMGLVHGPVDRLYRIRVSDRVVWCGSVGGSSRFEIDQPDAFGGDGAEGGISGVFAFYGGEPLQIPSTYLQGTLGTPLPAFRGVTCGILEQMYVSSNNPYLKPWSFVLSRTNVTTRGDEQWYVNKARIGDSLFSITESYDGATSQEPDSDAGTCNQDWRVYVEGWAADGYGERSDSPCSLGATNAATGIDPNAYDGTKESGYPPQAIFGNGRYYYCETAPEGWNDLVSEQGGLISTGDYWSIVYDSRSSVRSACNPLGKEDHDIMTARARNVDGSYSNGGDGSGQGYAMYCPPGSTPVMWQVKGAAQSGGSGFIVTNMLCAINPEVLPEPEPEPEPTACNVCGDMNPAHIIRECLTDKEWGMGYNAADIDDVSFTAAADTLYDEEMGISILWQRENTIEAFVQDIVRHIDAALYVDRRTGKFVLKLIRNDYDESALITLGPDQIERVENYKRPAFGDLVNSVTVIYEDCDDGRRLEVGGGGESADPSCIRYGMFERQDDPDATDFLVYDVKFAFQNKTCLYNMWQSAKDIYHKSTPIEDVRADMIERLQSFVGCEYQDANPFDETGMLATWEIVSITEGTWYLDNNRGIDVLVRMPGTTFPPEETITFIVSPDGALYRPNLWRVPCPESP